MEVVLCQEIDNYVLSERLAIGTRIVIFVFYYWPFVLKYLMFLTLHFNVSGYEQRAQLVSMI
jgi:hypothetical protein